MQLVYETPLSNGVLAVAVSRGWYAYAGGDNRVRVWAAASERPRYVIPSRGVDRMQFTPDGAALLMGNTHEHCIVEHESGKEVDAWREKVALFSPSLDAAATTDDEYDRLWHLDNRRLASVRCEFASRMPRFLRHRLAFSPCGRWFGCIRCESHFMDRSGSIDQLREVGLTLELIEVHGERRFSSELDLHRVSSLIISSGGERCLVVGGRSCDSSSWAFLFERGENARGTYLSLDGCVGRPGGFTRSGDAAFFVSDRGIACRDLGPWSCRWRREWGGLAMFRAFGADAEVSLVATGTSAAFTVFDASSGEPRFSRRAESGGTSLRRSLSGKYIAVARGRAQVWSVPESRVEWESPTAVAGREFSHDVVGITDAGELVSVDMERGEVLHGRLGGAMSRLELGWGASQALDVSADGALLAAAERRSVDPQDEASRRFGVWDLSTGARLWQDSIEGRINALSLDSSRPVLLAVARTPANPYDLVLEILDARSGDVRETFVVTNQGCPSALECSADGRLLALGDGMSAALCVVDRETGRCSTIKVPSLDTSRRIAFVDSRLLAIGCAHDSRIALLRLDVQPAGVSGTVEGWLEDEGSRRVSSIVSDPGARRLLSLGRDGSLSVWDVERRECLVRARISRGSVESDSAVESWVIEAPDGRFDCADGVVERLRRLDANDIVGTPVDAASRTKGLLRAALGS